MTKHRFLFLPIVCLSLFACLLPHFTANAGEMSPQLLKAASHITDASLRSRVKFLSSDLLEGRGPASRGDSLAQEYIATELEAMGVLPGGINGSWYQDVPLVGVTSDPPKEIVFSAGQKALTLKYFDEYIAVSGTQNPQSKIENAEVIFVGYGIVAPEYQWDDFKDVDVKGKILLVMNNDPQDDPKLFEGKRRLYYGRWGYKYEQAAKKGAVGVIIIHTNASASYPWQVIQTSWVGEDFRLPDDGATKLEMEGWASEDSCKKMVQLGGFDLDKLRALAENREFKPVPLGVNLSITIQNQIRKTLSRNVIGKIVGSDKSLSKEAVVYTAHHDHLGVKAKAKPGEDAIYNGALDNASGVATILSIAKAFASLAVMPKRSVYFVFVAAEEQGLLGSEYFAKHPPISPGMMAANINVDGTSIFGRTRDISLIGLGKSSLDSKILALAKMQGRIVKGEEFPDAGSFYRSDQFNFAKIGVPAAYIEGGTEVIGKPKGFGREQSEKFIKNDYHQPSDEYRDSWDLSGAVEDAKLMFYLGVNVGNDPKMPEWNKGDEFEATRKEALLKVMR